METGHLVVPGIWICPGSVPTPALQPSWGYWEARRRWACPVLLPPEISLATSCINGYAEGRVAVPPTQQVSQAVGLVGRPNIGAQVGNESYSSCLCPGRCQPCMKPMGKSPRESHRWTLGPTACRHRLFGATSVEAAEVVFTRSDCPRVNLRPSYPGRRLERPVLASG